MARTFKLPELGEGVEEATVVSLLVSPGEKVEEGQGLIEVESDKATAEVPADSAGTVEELFVSEGDTVKPGDRIASIETTPGKTDREDEDTAQAARRKPKGGEQQQQQKRKPESKGKATAGDQTAERNQKDKGKSAEPQSKRIELRLPELGEGVDEGEIVSLHVGAGDELEKGDTVLEIETDKATAEVPAEQRGTVVELKVAEGDTVRSGDVLAILKADADESGEAEEKRPAEDESDDEAPAPDEEASAETDEEEVDTTAARAGMVMATPRVRRLARELGLNVHALRGTGRGGRILEEDVKQAARRVITTGDRSGELISPVLGEDEDFDRFGPVEHVELNAVRRATARQMSASWQTSPHVTHFAEADFSAVQDARERLEAQAGEKVSFTAILVKVVARALQVFPDFNAVLDLDHRRLTRRRYVHIGVAADTPRGLLVPVLRHVDRKRVVTVSRELADLAGRARDSKVSAAEMQGAGFTVSNLGGLDGGWFTPLINPPEVAILGLGAATMKPVYDGADGFTPRPLLPLSLSYDHRAIDGAGAARFLRWLVDALENPLLTALEGSPS